MKISFAGYDSSGIYGKKNEYVIVAHIWEKFPDDYFVARGENEREAIKDLNITLERQ